MSSYIGIFLYSLVQLPPIVINVPVASSLPSLIKLSTPLSLTWNDTHHPKHRGRTGAIFGQRRGSVYGQIHAFPPGDHFNAKRGP